MPAPIISSTRTVSSAQAARSVRGVGWCSMVTLPPASHNRLRGRRDQGGLAGQHPDRGARGETARVVGDQVGHHPQGGQVHVGPAPPDGLARLTGGHSPR